LNRPFENDCFSVTIKATLLTDALHRDQFLSFGVNQTYTTYGEVIREAIRDATQAEAQEGASSVCPGLAEAMDSSSFDEHGLRRVDRHEAT